MAAAGSWCSHFILGLFCFFLHINPSLTFSLKNCTILYQATPSSGVSVDCTNGKLENLPEKIPKDAVSIEFRGNLLQKIKDEFHYMYRLKYLGLQNNGISYVDDGSFIDLVSLKTLIMRHNELFSLTRNMFQGLSNIMILDLSYNGIGFIHDLTFQFLTSLKYLDLDHNMLKNIAYIRPLIQLPQIQTLSLRCNDLSSFETKMLLLNETSNLEQLIISGQYLKKFSITTPIFPYLQMIDLSHCGIGNELKWEISDKMLLENVTQLFVEEGVLSFKDLLKVLKNLISLRHLRINMVFEWIRKGLFPSGCKLKSLRRLDLFQNSLEDLTLKLGPCSQLTELYLQETKLKELPEDTIHSLKMLEVLNVSSNNLNRVSYDIRSLTFLRILHLDNNYISKLNCEDFQNTTRLTELNLNRNQIAKLDKCVFEHLAELKHLDLSYNELRSFGDTFKVSLHKLEFLDISENDIDALEENSFEGLRSLRHLKMASDNVLLMQNNTFPEMRNLEDLNVSFPAGKEPDLQGLQHLENLTAYFGKGFTFRDAYPNKNGNIKNLTLLKRLTVTSSQYYSTYLKEAMKMLHIMTYLQIFKAANVYQQAPDVDTFQFNPQLKSLTLSNTDMSDLKPELFQPFQNLQSLDLSDSKLKSLNFLAHANLSALRYLKLTNNEILTINETFFTSLPSLTYLDLSNNQFTCDCSNALFIIWVKDNKQTQVVNAHQYECSFPPNKQGTLLLDFQVQLCWEDPGFFCFIFSTCLIVLTLLASLLYRFLRQRLIYTFQRFLAFLYDTRKRTNRDSYQYDAFVSYNAHNEEWVYKEMLPVLEGEQGWKLCLHHRDFQPGKPIIENITDAIYGSRKTICVISRHYLKSEWCSSEIQMASFRLFDEQKNVLILLFLEDIPSNHLSLYYGVRQLVKKCTYLSWPKTVQHPGVFWQNVMRALQAGDRVT